MDVVRTLLQLFLDVVTEETLGELLKPDVELPSFQLPHQPADLLPRLVELRDEAHLP